MRSISQFGGGAGNVGHQITGTQSLNRNLASRSTGALMMPSMNGGGGSSNLSDSNDSASHFHAAGSYVSNGIQQQQQQSSSAHHLAYIGQGAEALSSSSPLQPINKLLRIKIPKINFNTFFINYDFIFFIGVFCKFESKKVL